MPQQTIHILVTWRLLQRTDQSCQVPAGQTVGEFLSGMFLGLKPEEVLTIFNGRLVTLKDTLDRDGTLEIIPVLCGG